MKVSQSSEVSLDDRVYRSAGSSAFDHQCVHYYAFRRQVVSILRFQVYSASFFNMLPIY